jgi:3-hydroxyisobutyrate dehydrogenase-like beta-hydroxyacid dehydrogenase
MSNDVKVGIVGMGHVGKAVANNLMRKGYTVTAINDIKVDNCKGYPDSFAIKRSAREVAEVADIVVSGSMIRI